MRKGISETAFASQVEGLLTLYGWQWVHFRPARVMRRGREIYETAYSGKKGFLDYLALRPPRILVAELKDAYKPLTPEQEEWFECWKECQMEIASASISEPVGTLIIPEVYLWRPSQFEEVVECLR